MLDRSIPLRPVFAAILPTSLSVIAAALVAGSVSAEPIRVTCRDATSYIVDTENHTLATKNTREQIRWSYDGEWLRVQRQGGTPDLAFGLTTGMRIMDGQSPEDFCAFENPGLVSLLPISPGARLREEFIKQSAQDRRSLQQNLADFDYYTGAIDGLWGRGTEQAIISFFGDYKENLPTGTDPKTQAGADIILSALAGMIHEGSECDGCANTVDAPDTSDVDSRTASLSTAGEKPFSCNQTPFSRTEWMQRNSRKYATHAVIQEVNNIASGSGNGLSVQDTNRLIEIYNKYDAYAPAAEEYAIAKFRDGDHRTAAEWIVTAARDGMPLSSGLMYYLLGQIGEFAGLPIISTEGSILDVAEDCLRHALKNGEETAGLHLATLLISPPDAPAVFTRTANFKDDEALRLLDGLPSNIRAENQGEIATLKAIAQRRIDEQERQEQANQAKRVASAQAETERLSGICDGAIQLKGVCWSQSKDQMKTMLVSKNYACGTSQGIFGSIETCTQGEQTITFRREELSFSCENFNACRFTAEELGQEIVNQGFVTSLEPDIETFSDGVNTFYTKTYCGRGKAGDEICVVEDQNILTGAPIISVRLSKGALGSGGFNFD